MSTITKAEPAADYPPEEGCYLRGNDYSPVAVCVILKWDREKTPPAIEELVRVGAESGAALSGTLQTENIGLEMAGTVHNDNATGIKVSCYECHLPRAYWPKIIKKTKSGVKDMYHTMLGTIDTLEKFEAHRMHMATVTWAEMNENDSRECRYCHDTSQWDLASQSEKAQEYHAPALSNDKTCIDCHKGLAHKLPEGIVPDEQIPGIDPPPPTASNAEAGARG